MACEGTTILKVKRGTTPTVAFEIALHLDRYDEVRLCFKPRGRRGPAVVKGKGDLAMSFTGGVTTVKAYLTQEDTLGWKPGTEVDVQVRYRLGDAAGADDVCRLMVQEVLEEGVI